MENKKFIVKIGALSLALITASCTHWLIDTETRIRVKNETDKELRNLSLRVPETNSVKVLVPATLTDEYSKPYKHELVGKFNFAVFLGDSLIDLGKYELKGGTVYVEIREVEGELKIF